MTGRIKVPLHLRAKFDEVLLDVNRRKERIKVLGSDDSTIEIEYSEISEVFLLGRAFEPYKQSVKMGSSTINQDNSYLSRMGL